MALLPLISLKICRIEDGASTSFGLGLFDAFGRSLRLPGSEGILAGANVTTKARYIPCIQLQRFQKLVPVFSFFHNEVFTQ